MLEQLRPHLPALVAGPQGLQGLLRVLAPEDQMYLIQPTEELHTTVLAGGRGSLQPLPSAPWFAKQPEHKEVRRHAQEQAPHP